MKRWILAVLVAGGAIGVATAGGSPAGDPGIPRGSFYVVCEFSHRNNDDAIVFPGRPGRSHEHTYFGNRSTDASSTPRSLRAAGLTSCRLPSDTAAYWAPTLFVDGVAVEPLVAIAHYVRRTAARVRAFPAGLKIVGGDATAQQAQSRDVALWGCGASDVSTTVPRCPDPRRPLSLQVGFPNCWDGRNLDSADHRSHMAYSVSGICPTTHRVAVPQLILVIHYRTVGGPSTELSSGGQFSVHADFVNAWHQPTLERLVKNRLNKRP